MGNSAAGSEHRWALPLLLLGLLSIAASGGVESVGAATTPDGLPCSSGDQCFSGFCADRVCCDTACDAPDEFCGGSGFYSGRCLKLIFPHPSHTPSVTPLESRTATPPKTRTPTRTATSTATISPTRTNSRTETPTPTATPQARLAAALFAAATTALIEHGEVLPPSGSVRIDDEVVGYGSRTQSELASLSRGLAGTAAVPHSSGAAVLERRTVSSLDVFLNVPRRIHFGRDDSSFSAAANVFGATVNAFNDQSSGSATFRAAANADLEVGVYEDLGSSIEGETKPIADVVSCRVLGGMFHVLEIEYGGPISIDSRAVSVLAVDVEGPCEASDGLSLTAQVRYNSSLPTPTALPARLFRVPQDYASIQSAIDAARDGDTILVSPGEYDSIDYQAKNVAVVSESGPEVTVLLGEVDISRGESRAARLEGFRLQGGRGIFITDASPTIVGNVLVQTQGIVGLGVVSPLIVRNEVRDGGGVSCIGPGSAEIRENVVLRSGGISVGDQKHPVLADNVIVDGHGGMRTSLGLDASAVIVRNLIANNELSFGSAALDLSQTDDTIVAHNTIVGNRGTRVSGIHVRSSDDNLTLVNNIVVVDAGSALLCDAPNSFGTPPTLEGNDFFARSGNPVSDDCPDPAVGDNSSVDPLFVNESILDFHLAPDSPLIDAGVAFAADGVDTDGDALPRDGDLDGTAALDPGIDEFNPLRPTATPTSTRPPTAPPTGTSTPEPPYTPSAPGEPCLPGIGCSDGVCSLGFCCNVFCGAGTCQVPGYEGECLAFEVPTPPPSPTFANTFTPTVTPTAPTSTPTSTAIPSPTPGDANCDGFVTAADLTDSVESLARAGLPHCGGDLNHNGVIDAADIDAIVERIFAAD